MTILITGTTGFVGSKLKSSLLHKDYKIIEVNRDKKNDSITFDDADLKKCNADYWIHLAGKSQDITDQTKQEEYIGANVELTKKVFNAFLGDKTASTFIFVSSVKAAASKVKNILTEEDESDVDIPYGSSKRSAEKYLLSVKLPEEKKLIILRPPMIYGNNTKSNLYSLYKFVKRGLPYPFAAFKNSRTMFSIDNFIFVIEHIIAAKNFRGGIYNVADDDALSTTEIIELMGKSLGKKPNLWYVPKKIINCLGKVGDILHFPVNSKKINKLTGNYIVSNKKLLKEMETSLPYKTKVKLTELFEFYKKKDKKIKAPA